MPIRVAEALKRQDTWAIVSSVSGAIAALAALVTVYQARQAAMEQRLAQRPYLRLTRTQIEPSTPGVYRIGLTLENSGASPAGELEERIFVLDAARLPHVAVATTSIGNEIAVGDVFTWTSEPMRLPPTPHFFVMAVAFSGPLSSQRFQQVFIVKWKGMVEGTPSRTLDHPSRDEHARMLGAVRERLPQ